MSRNFILVLMLCLASFGAWRHFKGDAQQVSSQASTEASSLGSSSEGTVVVYGRDNCSYTRKTLAALQANGVPVTYVNIDYTSAYNAFHDKFDGTGLAGERGYALPVVELAGRASMRPDPEAVAREFIRTQ
ncbi:hypothetical protein [Pseudoxanthomonas sp. UTMC 1351]|uniref:hypothetical protein n=1 Tax=Pseudoxanthomonas sp. UTMC 1351 TaxID=2695853 RepID=UPI0034CF8720